MVLSYSISDVEAYINWIYFFHAWCTSGMPKNDKDRLREEAERRLADCRQRYRTHAIFKLFNAHSSGDDILVDAGGSQRVIPLLRQQAAASECLCLADFVHPSDDRVGLFATTVDAGLEHDFDDDPYEKMMMQLLADRLAEATAERLHEEVRKTLWGYAQAENLTVSEMLAEQWQGIRPAVGYPSLPDMSVNFIFDELLNLSRAGICLTESGAMRPHASVSGLMLAHPQAHYFTVGRISDEQLNDYASRRGLPVETMRRFLAANL